MLGHRYGFLLVLWALWLVPSVASAQTRVACVGDSITYGYGLGNRDQQAYPAMLAELLGPEFEVGNYGDSGSTLQDAGDKPWREQAVYGQCLAFVPNVVVIMLGTNDAKPLNWSEAGFAADYRSLIAEFRELGASVYVATPPPVVPPGNFEIQPAVVNETLAPLVRQLAADEGASLIDVYAALEGKPELLPDTVHPNAAGARVIAETVADALLTSDETSTSTSTGTNTAVTSATNTSTSGAGGAGGSTTLSGSTGPAASATSSSPTASSAGPTSGGATSSQAANSTQSSSSQTSSSAPSSGQSSTGPTSSGPSANATTTQTTTGGGTTGLGGAAAASSDEGAGCACSFAAAPRVPWFWGLVPLLALARRRARHH